MKVLARNPPLHKRIRTDGFTVSMKQRTFRYVECTMVFSHNNCVFSVLFHRFVQVGVADVDRAATIQTQAAQPVAIFLTCSWLPFYRVFISLCHFSFLITFPSVISPPAPCHFLSTFHRRQIHAEPAIQLLNYRLCIFSLYFFILKF